MPAMETIEIQASLSRNGMELLVAMSILLDKK
jgi:hypothetical protein